MNPIVASWRRDRTTLIPPKIFSLDDLTKGPSLLLKHGYSGDTDSITDAYDRITMRCEGERIHFPNLLHTYSPSGYSTLRYARAAKNARASAAAFAKVISDTYIATGNSPIVVLAHSLGCYESLCAAGILKDQGNPALNSLTLFLTGPAVDWDAFEADGEFFSLLPHLRILVFYSPNDEVLGKAYPIGDWMASLLDFKLRKPTKALGHHGPSPATLSSPLALTNLCCFEAPDVEGHSGYKSSFLVYDMLLVVRKSL